MASSKTKTLLIYKFLNDYNHVFLSDDLIMVTAPRRRTKDVIKNPVNPFTKKKITEFDKSNGIQVLDDSKYNPKYFKEDECIFKQCSKIKNIFDILDWDEDTKEENR